MKKLTILLALMMATSLAKAQEIVTDFHHENGNYFNIHNIVEACDNTLIVECPMFEPLPYVNDLGNMFYKVSLEGELLDSLFIESNNVPLRTLFEPVPDGNGDYFYARFEQEESDSTTYLRLTFIDADLNITDNIETAIETPMSQQTFNNSETFIDTFGNLIVSYKCPQGVRMLRIGLDGTVLDNKLITEIPSNIQLQIHPTHTGIYGQSPLRYYFLARRANDSGSWSNSAYILDSTFNLVDCHKYDKIASQTWFLPFESCIMPYDDTTYLYGSECQGPIDGHMRPFLALAKFDLNHDLIGTRFFFVEDKYASMKPIGIEVTSPDTIYYAYMTDAGAPNQLVLACLDAELNVRWTRYFLEADYFHDATCMVYLGEGKVAVGSYRYGQNPGSISVVVIEDKLWDVPENQDWVRPYAFYPNPAKDQLHLQFSPDVTPTQIDLYDLQGRLVRTQRNGLETLEMSGLAAGTYTMRVTLEDGKVFSDKVVKE